MSTCCAFTSSLQVSSATPLTDAWKANVVINGGAAPSALTVRAIRIFEGAIQSILSKMIAINVIAPDSMTAALTPFLVGPGLNPWVNVNATLNINGLAGNAANARVNTGVSTNAFDFGGAGIEMYNMNAAACQDAYDLATYGANTGGPNAAYLLNCCSCFYGVRTEMCLGNDVGVGAGGDPINGFYAEERESTTSQKLYMANSVHAFAQEGATDATAIVDNRGPNNPLYMFAVDTTGGGVFGGFSNKRQSYVSMSKGLTAAQAQTLFNAVQALRNSFGGGFV